MNPYISDILSQPAVLRAAVENFSVSSLAPIAVRIQKGEFDRLIITGMGASYNAAYPAYIQLSELPIPTLHINAAELVHYLSGLIEPRTLLWINSQSGRSAEILHLLERIKTAPSACLLTCVNDESSPLASASEICLPIHAGPETTVSTKTYTNTLAVNLLAANYLTGSDIEALKKMILATADAIETYLDDWQNHVSTLDTLLGEFETMILIGRGASMAAVWNGALINKEAAKFPLEGMNAADFRHGPLELVSPGFVTLFFAGSSETLQYNRNLALDVLKHSGRVLWIDAKKDVKLPTILIPDAEEIVLPLVEILPTQFLTLVMAERKDIKAGEFKIVGKVTTVE